MEPPVQTQREQQGEPQRPGSFWPIVTRWCGGAGPLWTHDAIINHGLDGKDKALELEHSAWLLVLIKAVGSKGSRTFHETKPVREPWGISLPPPLSKPELTHSLSGYDSSQNAGFVCACEWYHGLNQGLPCARQTVHHGALPQALLSPCILLQGLVKSLSVVLPSLCSIDKPGASGFPASASAIITDLQI